MSYTKTNYDLIKRVLQELGETEPNCLFVGANGSYQYLLFYEGDIGEVTHIIHKYEGEVYYISRYGALGIRTDDLFDNRDK